MLFKISCKGNIFVVIAEKIQKKVVLLWQNKNKVVQ